MTGENAGGRADKSSIEDHPLPYAGSKRSLAEWVVGQMPDHRVYVEPFCGSAAVLATKPRSPVETINDANGHLTTLLRVLRDSPDALTDRLRETPYARAEYERAAGIVTGDHAADGTLDHAAAYAFFLMSNFGAKPATKAGFARESASRGGSVARMYQNRIERLDVLADRLRGVTIESRDWRAVVDSHDHADTLFYLDPPYPDSAQQVGGPIDYDALGEVLTDEFAGEWLLSFPCVPEWATTETVLTREHRYRIARDVHADADEYLVCSFDPDDCRTLGDKTTLAEWGGVSA